MSDQELFLLRVSLFQAEMGSQCSLSHLRQQQQLPKQRTLTNTHAGSVGGGTLPCRLSRISSNSNQGTRCKGGAMGGGGDEREQQQKYISPKAEESQHSPGPDTHSHTHSNNPNSHNSNKIPQSTSSNHPTNESQSQNQNPHPHPHSHRPPPPKNNNNNNKNSSSCQSGGTVELVANGSVPTGTATPTSELPHPPPNQPHHQYANNTPGQYLDWIHFQY
ncbi:uncharacterized protein LOC134848833 [Symsagittifera roscoffensis]|uniref:uncharacterized protein LOC134848833 n=1 Tax=Symsagittifera roscoffensis TaxID=84072 RepID=UPI00307C729E